MLLIAIHVGRGHCERARPSRGELLLRHAQDAGGHVRRPRPSRCELLRCARAQRLAGHGRALLRDGLVAEGRRRRAQVRLKRGRRAQVEAGNLERRLGRRPAQERRGAAPHTVRRAVQNGQRREGAGLVSGPLSAPMNTQDTHTQVAEPDKTGSATRSFSAVPRDSAVRRKRLSSLPLGRSACTPGQEPAGHSRRVGAKVGGRGGELRTGPARWGRQQRSGGTARIFQC